MLNYFTISGLFISVINFCLAFLISFFGKTRLHRTWALVNYSISLWGLGIFIIGFASNYDLAIIGWRIFIVGITLISTLYYHVIHIFCRIKSRKFLVFSYLQALIFIAVVLFSDLMIGSQLAYRFGKFYYLRANYFYSLYFVVWIIIVSNSFYVLKKFIEKTTGLLKKQSLYLFIAMLFGFGGGATTAPAAWGFDIYPYGQILVCVYGALATYAIFRYHLMDIKVAFSRFGIFIFVYAVVLGIPFIFGYRYGMWQSATWSMLLLATAGPFIYIFLQRKAEGHLLQEERRTQELLLQASYGMNMIHHLDRLVELIVGVVMKILRLDRASIYLLDREGGEYQLASSNHTGNAPVIQSEHSLIAVLKETRAPVLCEELKMRDQSGVESDHARIITLMNDISSSVAVPISINGTLLGFLALGDRQSRELYSKDLLSVLMVLGNQAALAIENCHFLEAEARRMEQMGLDERRMSLDHVTSSMAHEIDNPMAVIQGQVDVLAMDIEDPRITMPDELRASINKSMDYILEARRRVSGMILAIREYSQKTTGEFRPVTIQEVYDGYWKLFGPEFQKSENRPVEYVKDIAADLPYILGDKIQLEEIFFNFANNALCAVRHSEVKKILLKVFLKNDDWIRVEYADTGSGIDPKIIKDIFLAHVTTKGSSEGTGLGLFRVRKIVECHQGKVWAESAGKDHGTMMVVELPVFKGDVQAVLDQKKESFPPAQGF